MLTAKGHVEISDTEYSRRTSISIVEYGNLLIDPPDKSAVVHFPILPGTDKIYSPYGIGLSFIFVPYVIAGKLLSVISTVEERIIINFLISFYNIPFAIMGLWFFKKIVILLGGTENRANIMTTTLALGTGYWKYTTTDFSEVTQASFLLGMLYYLLQNNKGKWLKISFWFSLLILIKLTYFIFLPVLCIYLFWDNEKSEPLLKKGLNLFIFIIPTGIGIATLNYLRFNNIFESGYGSIIKFSLDFFTRDWFGYLFSFERGIFFFNPIILVSILGFLFVPREKRVSIILVGIFILVWYLVMCFWVSWQGGYCWGNRLLVPIIPLLLLPLTFIPCKNFFTKMLLFSVLLVSIFIQFSASFTKIHEIIEIKLKIQEITEESPSSQLYRSVDLFIHKLKTSKAEYPVSNFGVQGAQTINLTEYDTFHGFNLWIVHLLNHAGLRTLSYGAGVTVLFITIFLCIALFLSQKSKQI